MAKTINYYDYWNKKRASNRKILMREEKALELISQIGGKNSSLIDLGCGNGNFLLEIKSKFPSFKLKGIDYSPLEVKEALERGLDVIRGNLETGVKISEKQDLAYAGEIIEHLYNPDFFLEQINNLLKSKGYLILTTPNLCAWFNRILLPLGMQPLFLEPSTKSKLVGAGILSKFKQGSQPVGHVRIFTLQALTDMLEMNGFKIIKVMGAEFQDGFPKSILWFDRIFNVYPRLASNLIILAQKID